MGQVKLAHGRWAYLSTMLDEGSRELLAAQVSVHPEFLLVQATLYELFAHLPADAQPIIHSGQGWHYQAQGYQDQLLAHNLMQSMSRKGYCLDNAPVESFFHLFKTECFNGRPLCENLANFTNLANEYVNYYNYQRISLKQKGMTPVEYRNHALAALSPKKCLTFLLLFIS